MSKKSRQYGLFVAVTVLVLGLARVGAAQQGVSILTHGNGAELIVCDASVAVNITSATNTQLVALVNGKTIFVCAVSLHLVGAATPVVATFTYGTGSACATSTVSLTGPFTGATAATATTPVVIGANLGYAFKTIASNALCITSTGTAGINGVVTYTQF